MYTHTDTVRTHEIRHFESQMEEIENCQKGCLVRMFKGIK